jgi:hypothetical protein
MSKRLEIKEGDKFNRLTVISEAPQRRGSYRYFNVVCDCGKYSTVFLGKLKNGSTKSCGCFSAENAAKRNFRHGGSVGGVLDKEYVTWSNMTDRCRRPKNQKYKNYGARGISVCNEWLGENGYSNFLSDMGKKPIIDNVRYTIERRDVNGNYCKENCYWGTDEIQANNKTTSHFIEHLGEKKTIAQWAKKYQTKYETFRKRLIKSEWNIWILNCLYYPEFVYLKQAS